jgi:hypothetical protein
LLLVESGTDCHCEEPKDGYTESGIIDITPRIANNILPVPELFPSFPMISPFLGYLREIRPPV